MGGDGEDSILHQRPQVSLGHLLHLEEDERAELLGFPVLFSPVLHASHIFELPSHLIELIVPIVPLIVLLALGLQDQSDSPSFESLESAVTNPPIELLDSRVVGLTSQETLQIEDGGRVIISVDELKRKKVGVGVFKIFQGS